MEILSTIFYFLIVIGVLVFVHEFGHFFAARMTGMRAEVFAFGMGYRLFGWNRVNGFTFGKLNKETEETLENHTDYRICAFPIGGYVKIPGMIDESMDKEFINKPPQPWEYRAKPVWKRMIVITAGVIMNILLAFIIFYSYTLFKGKSNINTTTVGYVTKNSTADEFGITKGDKILSINNNKINYWNEIDYAINIENMAESISIVLLRNSQTVNIQIPKEKIGILNENPFGIEPENYYTFINGIESGKPADKIGIQSGDTLISIAGVEVRNAQEIVRNIKSNTNNTVELKWKRNGNVMSGTVLIPKDSLIGISIGIKYEGPVNFIKYNALSAIPPAISEMWYFGVELFFKSIGKIITGDIPFNKAIGGPIKIAQASAKSAESGFASFIKFVALLSMSLAVINILPFPALDGGHFVILIWEAIFRRPVPHKVQIVLQNVGFILLIALMLFVIYNDIISIK